MPDNNGSDWREKMERMMDQNWEERKRFREDQALLERNIKATHDSLIEQKKNVDNLLDALRKLIDRIPPENLR